VRAWFSLREATPGAALICVVHITKNGRMAGAEKLRHLCHAVVYVTSRHISIPGKSRFGPPKKIARPKLK
jgi:predicted ATP-dependent serine protease